MLGRAVKGIIRGTLGRFGLTIGRIDASGDRRRDAAWHDLSVALEVATGLDAPPLEDYRDFHAFAAAYRRRMHAQNYQDVFALWALGSPRGGTFVEFGADDGVTGSNTLLLESEFGWQGLLLEPNRGCHAALAANRGCRVDHRAVSRVGGRRLEFLESTSRQLSRLATDDAGALGDAVAGRYEVTTVTLDEALREHGIGRGFDFLSIDVEGAELDVLAGFSVAEWCPGVVVIEHNGRPDEGRAIDAFFSVAGYEKCLPGFARNDSWFIHASRRGGRSATTRR